MNSRGIKAVQSRLPAAQPVQSNAGAVARVGALTAILLMWLHGWLPNLISAAAGGRGVIRGLEAIAPESPLASLMYQVLLVGVLAALVASSLASIPALAGLRPAPYFALLLAWAAIVVLPALTGASALGSSQVLFPLLLLPLAAGAVTKELLYRALMLMTVFMAVLSVVMGLSVDIAFMPRDWSLDAEKALIGDQILAGPYSHSNLLGVAMVLGLPLVLTQLKGAYRFLSLAFVIVAIVWSASRISLAVTVVILLIALIALVARREKSRLPLLLAAIGAAATMLLLPLLTTDKTFATGRGRIWIEALRFQGEGPLIGHGPTAFRVDNALTSTLAYYSTTGHNTLVTVYVTGGIIAVAAAAAYFFQVLRFSSRIYPTDRVPLVFLGALLWACVLEDPIRGLDFGAHSYIVFPMLVFLAGGTVLFERSKQLPGRRGPTEV